MARRIARVGAPLLLALGATWRVRVYGHQLDLSRSDFMFAFLHGDMLVPALVYRWVPAAILISQHGDGELIAQAVERLGRHIAVRGSSTRGGAAACLEMLRGRGELPWGITPDGPRGPRGHVHEGAIHLAVESGRPIVAAGFAVSRGRRLRSWDSFVIPRPFARIAAFYAEPLQLPRAVDRAQRGAFAAQLEERLRFAHEEAVRALANW
jgi:lysophospholipid acyltransferase (LPLAT)-like uncharacterized protein